MRSQDIEVGELYKIGWSVCGKVLETRVENRYTGRRDGVRVEIQEPASRKGEVSTYSSRELKSTWAVHQREQSERQAAQRFREELVAERQAQVESMEAQLRDSGIEVDRINSASWGSLNGDDFQVAISLSASQLRRMIKMLGSPEARQRGARSAQADAAVAQSALEQMFG